MTITTTHELVDLDGRTLVREGGVTPVPWTLRAVLTGALMGDWGAQGDRPTGEEKFTRGQLAMRVHGQERVELTAEEVALCKLLVGYGFTPLVVAQVYPLLDGVGALPGAAVPPASGDPKAAFVAAFAAEGTPAPGTRAPGGPAA